MKKVRLTEKDLNRIVKRVINEQNVEDRENFTLTDFPESIPSPVVRGYILYKDGWIFNNHSLDKPFMWPAIKKLKDSTQDDIMNLEFFLEENSKGLYDYERLTQYREYNPNAKRNSKTVAVFVSDDIDVYNSMIPPRNEDEFERFKNNRGMEVVFLTKSNSKSAALKNEYLSQYNDLSGFRMIPVMFGPNGLEQI